MSGDFNITGLTIPEFVVDAINSGDSTKAQAAISQYLDSMEEDQRKIAVNLLVTYPQIPLLIPPETFMIQIQDKEAELISSFLDAWVDQIEKEGERIREKLNSPGYQAQLEQMRAMISDSGFRALYPNQANSQEDLEEVLQRVNLAVGTGDFYKEGSDKIAGAVMLSAFIIGAAFVGGLAQLANPTVAQLAALGPIQEAGTHMAALITPNLQTAFAVSVNFFALGAVYYTHAESIANAKGKVNAESQQYATAFAANLVKWIHGDKIDNFIKNVLSRTNITNLDPKQLQQLNQIAKFTLLSVAWAAVVKDKTGYVSDADFQAFLQGNAPEDPVERALWREFKSLMEEMLTLSPQLQGKAVECMCNYLKTNPKLKDLMKPAKVFQQATAEIFNTVISA